jgi:hypothetical protein
LSDYQIDKIIASEFQFLLIDQHSSQYFASSPFSGPGTAIGAPKQPAI